MLHKLTLFARALQIFDQIYMGMMVMLISYFALFSVKKFAIGTALTIPLIILLILYRGAITTTFKRPMEVLSLHAAADLDRADKVPISPLCSFIHDNASVAYQAPPQHLWLLRSCCPSDV
jgi:hypothetical protein